jgi:hypothetical protein
MLLFVVYLLTSERGVLKHFLHPERCIWQETVIPNQQI